MAVPCFVIVRERAVERVLPSGEIYGNLVGSMGRMRVVGVTVVLSPLLVPVAHPIRHRIVAAGFSPIQKTVVTISFFHG